MNRRTCVRTLLVAAPALWLGAGCSSAGPGGTAKITADWPLPPLGGVLTCHLSVSSSQPAPYDGPGTKTTHADVFISLSDGISLADSQETPWIRAPQQQGRIFYIQPTSFQANISRSFTVHVRLDKLGEQQIGGGCRVYGPYEGQEVVLASGGDDLYLRVTAEGTQFIEQLSTPTP